MNIEYTKYIDYILNALSNREHLFGENLSTIMEDYQEETGEKQDLNYWNRMLRIAIGNGLAEREGTSSLYRITEFGIEILEQHGTYLKYVEYKNEQKLKDEEIKKLQRKNLKLQNENLEFENENKGLKRKILILDEKAKKWDIIKSYWWLIGVLLAIAIFAGDLLDIITQ